MDRLRVLRQGGVTYRSSVLQARLPPPDVDGRGPAQSDRLRLWRAGNDERPVVVAGQHAYCLCQQYAVANKIV